MPHAFIATLREAAAALAQKLHDDGAPILAEVHETDTGAPFAILFDPDCADGAGLSLSLAGHGDAWVLHCNQTDIAIAVAPTLLELVWEFDQPACRETLAIVRARFAGRPIGGLLDGSLQEDGRAEPVLVRGCGGPAHRKAKAAFDA